ncbi:MAG TPA: DUF3788 family protein [Bacteroidales bacterium]|jgi:hypothetical protein|nr:DUF3788 family protein [Bacteroidales bacterium]
MAEKETVAFSNPSLQPGDDLVFSLIGEKKKYWQGIIKHLVENYTDISWSWNWYNDGKRWLFKLVQKKKTVFWAAVLATCDFRVTFYFGDKAEPFIQQSDLPERVKTDFMFATKYGAIRPVTTLVQSEEDVRTVLKLAEIKLKLK